LNARVASTSSNRILNNNFLDLGNTLSLDLWCNSFSGTIDETSILHDTLDKPVTLITANNSIINTSLAEIKVAVLTRAAVIMNIRDRLIAVVAENGEDAEGLL
jgi:hypothetical protein